MPRSFDAWAAQGQFWGKAQVEPTTGELTAWLPLRQHSIDVAQVLYGLLNLTAVRQLLERLCGHSLSPAQLAQLAVVAFFHDTGKLSLGFQSKLFAAAPFQRADQGHVTVALTSLFSEAPSALHVSAHFPGKAWTPWFSSAKEAWGCYLAAWSHHGVPFAWADSQVGAQHGDLWARQGALDAAAEMQRMDATVRQQFPEAFGPSAAPLVATPAFQHVFAGLVTLADWLASNSEFFPLTGTALTDGQRIALARQQTPRVLRSTWLAGLDEVLAEFEADAAQLSYAQLFALPEPRPLQAGVAALDLTAAAACTVVAESDTGSGKTEAALFWWARLRAAKQVNGLYFALPTRVAAREMYHRLDSFVARAYPPESRPPVVLAVPGYVQHSAATPLPSAEVLHPDDVRLTALGRFWAAERPKRFLAAPIAVGTVDQAVLAMLQTPHAHLRLALLDRQLLVVDEVHASDAYLRKALQDLLAHRRLARAPTLLLSATLGSEARQQLLGLPAEISHVEAVAKPYPLLTTEDGTEHPVKAATVAHKRVRVDLAPIAEDPGAIAARVAAAVERGQRVLVVLNTVTRAVAVQQAVETRLGSEFPGYFRVNDRICPHHGRYAGVDRERLDAAVQSFIGMDAAPGGRVVVGTQTLEQSLNINADVLVTDLCPGDVLLQRMGRLWRDYLQRLRQAPDLTNGAAECIVLTPSYPLAAGLRNKAQRSALARLGFGEGSVYPDLRLLELTRRYFDQESALIELPRDNRRLVEYVVHSEQLARFTAPDWQAHAAAITGLNIQQRELARTVSAREVYAAAFGTPACRFDHKTVATRLGEPAYQVVLAEPTVTPFGATLRDLPIPARFVDLDLAAPGAAAALATPADICEHSAAGFTCAWHGRTFRYDRFGLRPLH